MKKPPRAPSCWEAAVGRRETCEQLTACRAELVCVMWLWGPPENGPWRVSLAEGGLSRGMRLAPGALASCRSLVVAPSNNFVTPPETGGPWNVKLGNV